MVADVLGPYKKIGNVFQAGAPHFRYQVEHNAIKPSISSHDSQPVPARERRLRATM
jgi:hypothetical protein